MEAVTSVFSWVCALPVWPVALAFMVVGVAASWLMTRAATRCDPACRPAWIAIGITCLLWMAGYCGLIVGMPGWWVWAVMHPLSLVCVVIGMLAFPGVKRAPSAWVLVGLDGWMSVGGAAVVAWLVLSALMRQAGGTPHWPFLAWTAVDLVVSSALAGLLARAPGDARRAVAFVSAAAVIASIADLNLALTGEPMPSTLLWMVTTAVVGLCPVFGGPNLFLNTFVDSSQPRVIRLSQLPLVPAVVFLFVPIEHDWVANLGAAAVIAICFGNVAVNSRQNARLLGTVSEQRGQFEAVLTGSQDAILQLAHFGEIEFASPASTRVLGYPEGALIGVQYQDLIHPDDRLAAELGWKSQVEAGGQARLEFRLRHADGEYRFMESTGGMRKDGSQGWVVSTRDVSVGVALRDRLAHQARTDPLTGLLNRAAMITAVGERLAQDGTATLLFIDLDDFKAVNDTLGHAAGDDVLVQVAARLRGVIGSAEGVARLGGDEFAVLLGSGSGPAEGRRMADAILDGIARVRTPEQLSPGRASIGIASEPAQSPADLVRDADLAMYQAKAAGGNVAVVFEPWMRERMLERKRLRGRLERAIGAGGLALALQPVVELGERAGQERWQGFEALVRWPDGGTPRMPDEFLPLAEESGLIVPLGGWVLQAALRSLADWEDQLPSGSLTVAVNVSPRQLEDDDYAEQVLTALAVSDIAPGRLTLEITEQTAVQHFGSTAQHLATLRANGVHVAIDDFGTGYSSLRYLTRLPVDALKIDKQFVAGLGVRPEDEVLVTSMLRLAADLGLDVVAEGVETPLQADLLRAHGCQLAQGYLFSRPLPMDQLLAQQQAERGAGGARNVQSDRTVPDWR